MAINWEVKISEVNIEQGRADVTATRTDTESSLPPKAYVLDNTPIATSEERIAVLNWIKEQVLAAEALDNARTTYLAGLEQSAKSSLETWEAERAAE